MINFLAKTNYFYAYVFDMFVPTRVPITHDGHASITLLLYCGVYISRNKNGPGVEVRECNCFGQEIINK